MKQIKSHKFIYEWNPFFCFKKFRFVLMIKKIDFGLSKYQICFVRLKKRVFGDKNSDMFCDKKMLLIVKKKNQICFYYKKKKIYEEDLIHKIISCYMTQTLKQQFMISFFISKICICFNKNHICILRKIQISFDVRKI